MSIYGDEIAVYHCADYSRQPWASVRVGDYLRYVQSGNPPSSYKTFAPDWKNRDKKVILAKASKTIGLIRGNIQPKERKGLKSSRLPAVTWGHCDPVGVDNVVLNRKDTAEDDHGTRFMCFDIDGIATKKQAENERDRLAKAIPSAVVVALSASGKGVWLVIALDRHTTSKKDYKDIWWMLMVYLEEHHNVKIGEPKGGSDIAPSSMVSLRYYSYDPNARIKNEDDLKLFAVPNNVPTEAESRGKIAPTVENSPLKVAISNPAHDTNGSDSIVVAGEKTPTKKKKTRSSPKSKVDLLEEMRLAMAHCNENGITNVVYDGKTFSCFCLGAKQAEMPDIEQETWLKTQDGNKDDIHKRIASTNLKSDDQTFSVMSLFEKRGYKWKNKPKKSPPKKKKKKKKDGRPDGADTPVKGTNRPLVDYQACLAALGIKYRDHAFLGVQINRNDGKGWVNYSSGISASIYQKIQEKCYMVTKIGEDKEISPANFFKGHRDEAVDALVHDNKHNPLIDYLKSIKPCNDPISRWSVNLFRLLYRFDVGEIIEKQYTPKQIERYFADALLLEIKGLFVRWKEDDKRPQDFPFFAVLKGSEGIGKSLCCKYILPPKIAEEGAFVGSLDMAQSRKEKDLLLRSAAIVECSEMVGYSRRDVAEHKSLISSTQTKHRTAYQRYPEQIIRKAIMIATTNDDECFAVDPNEQRRHIPLPVALHPEWDEDDVHENIRLIWSVWRDTLFGYAKYEIEQGRGCSYKWWAKESREIRKILVRKSEKQPVNIDMAIEDLLGSNNLPGDDQKKLTESEKENGIPLYVPAGCDHRSIQKMLLANTSRLAGFPRHLTPKYIASRLKGWEVVKRTNLNKPYANIKVTLYRPKPLTYKNDPEYEGSFTEQREKQEAQQNEDAFIYNEDGHITHLPGGTPRARFSKHNQFPTTPDRPPTTDKQLPRMTTHEEDAAKEAKSHKELDELYLHQRLGKD